MSSPISTTFTLAILSLASAGSASAVLPRQGDACDAAFSRLGLPASTQDTSFMKQDQSLPWILNTHNTNQNDMCLVCYSETNPAPNHAPSFAGSLPAGDWGFFSIASSERGNCAPVFPATILIDGNIDNTLVEFNTDTSYPIIDVSTERDSTGNEVTVDVTEADCTVSNQNAYPNSCSFPSGTADMIVE